MNPLMAIWQTTAVLFGISLGWTVLIVAARFARERVARRNRKLKREFLAELMPVLEAGKGEAELVKRWRRRKSVMSEAGLEIAGLLRGRERAQVQKILTQASWESAVIPMLQSRKVERRLAAAEALACLPNRETTAALLAAMKDRHRSVREAATLSLVQIGHPFQIEEIIEAVSSRRATYSVRVLQIFSILALNSIKGLRRIALDAGQATAVRVMAIQALPSAGDYSVLPDLQRLADDLELDVRIAALRCLGRIAHPAAAATIAKGLHDTAWQVRAVAAEAAGRVGLPDQIGRLAELLDDDLWWVRQRSGEALVALGSAGVAALQALRDSGTGRKNQAAALILSEQGGQ
jgi:HEAT repeat protein